jgi:hypothetical protein
VPGLAVVAQDFEGSVFLFSQFDLNANHPGRVKDV